ncbi:Cleavage and polyadenylation specificity factor subunit 1 [Chytriomyces hyalinus]|nr:Cleavage and polyadenylation specificity factor subunit 1 [Chytriomyces hyalinus]
MTFALSATQHAPSGIEHVAHGVFTGPRASNLLVARGSLLQVFVLSTPGSSVGADGRGTEPGPSTVDEAGRRLTLLAQFSLAGVITSMATVRLPNTAVGLAGMDSLLIAFADAKMSLVEYSRSTASLTTVSIHYFERDELKKELTVEKAPPELRVDPQSRCAALSFYGDRMAILPFRHDVAHDADDPSSKYPFHPSYVFKVSDIDSKVRRIIDFVFLFDFFEPTLAILYETHQSWTGRLAARKDNRGLLVVSVNTSKKTFPVLYQSQHLPYNSTQLIPMPSPLGGLLVKSNNALIYVDQTSLPGVAIAFNAFYGREHALPTPPPAECQGPPNPRDNLLYHKTNVTDHKSWGITLEGAEVVQVNPDTVLVVCADGELFVVEMVGHDDAGSGWARRNGGVRRFRATRCGVRATVPETLCRMPVGGRLVGAAGLKTFYNEILQTSCVYVFVGSRLSDSLLLKVVERSGVIEFGDKMATGSGSSAAASSSAPSSAPTKSRYGRRIQEVEEDDDDDLYGESETTAKASEKNGKLRSGANSTNTTPPNGAVAATASDESAEKPARFTLGVIDVLAGLGPIRDMAVGEFKRETSDEYTPDDNTLRRELEAVCCVGQGVYGALGILARNIRPEIHTTVDQDEIKGFKEVWTVKCFDPNSTAAENQYHKYLIMSNENTTTVLQTGREINQVTDSGFFTAGCSVFVTSVLKETAIMQVQPNGVLLLSYDGKLIQNIEIGDTDTWVVSCSVSDNYVILLLCDGGLILLKSDETTRSMTKVFEKKDASISSASLYCNPAGSMSLQTVETVLQRQGRTDIGNSEANTETDSSNGKRKRDSVDDEDDDDDDLYGTGKDATNAVPMADAGNDQPGISSANGETTLSDSVYCFAYKEDGSLEVLLLPEFTQVFNVPQFDNLAASIFDYNGPAAENTENLERGADINEILVLPLGPDAQNLDVYLMARTETGDLIIYKALVQDDFSSPWPANAQAVSYTPTTPIKNASGNLPDPNRLALILVRVPHSHMSRELLAYQDIEGDKLKPLPKPRPNASFVKRHYLRPFKNVGSAGNRGSLYSGVFMTGKKPCWVMANQGGDTERAPGLEVIEGMEVAKGLKVEETAKVFGKGFLRVHPSIVDGEIRTFAELHNMNTPNGFVYINEKGLLRLCTLPWKFNYDLEWPMCKIPLRRVPHKIAYHFESETYIMAASTPSAFNLSKAQQAAALASGAIEQGFELNVVEERAKEDRTGLYYPSSGAYSLELISPVDFQTVDRFPLEVDEVVLCCQAVSLDSKQTTSGKKLFLAVGTGMCRGEDLTARGRILIFDIIDVVPEIDNPQSCHKFKLLHTVDEKSPVTALCGLNGYLVCANGSRMIIYNFEDSETLNGIAFLDTNIYVNNLTSIKNTLVLSDVAKGVWFIGFQEDPPKLKMLGKDYNAMQVYGCEYIVDDNTMGFIASDQERNMHVLSYMPDSFQSYEGQKLIRKGEMHMGTRIQKFVRLRKLPVGRNRYGAIIFSKQYFCIGGALDGSLNYTIPCSEKLYKRLYVIYSRMVTNIQPLAGLNPRGYRQAQLRNKPLSTLTGSGPPGPKSILDGDLLLAYISLPILQQREIAKGVGSSVERIIDDLIEVFTGTDYL